MSNDGPDGNTSLRIVDLPGGAQHVVRAERRVYRSPVGRLLVAIGGRTPEPARVSVTGPDGRSFAPDSAWRHADDGFDRRERRFEYGYLHTARPRPCSRCRAGRYTVEVSRGPETRVERRTVEVRAGADTAVRVALRPLERSRRPRLVQRRPPRPHELRRRLPQAPRGGWPSRRGRRISTWSRT